MSASASSTHLGRPWSRIGPCLFVLACVPIGMLIFATSMYLVGKHSEDRRSMLKNYRAPNHFEIQSFFLMDYVLNSSEMNDVLFIGDSTVLRRLAAQAVREGDWAEGLLFQHRLVRSGPDSIP